MLLVRDWMTGKLVTLSPEASVAEALTLCRQRRIRHIPILERGHLVGVVSDRDLRDASPALGDPERASALQKIRVKDVMTREVITADPEDSIENVAQEMYEHKIQSLPVVTEGPVVAEGSAVAEEELLVDGHILRRDAGPGNARWVARARLPDRSPGGEQGGDPGRGGGKNPGP